MNKKIGFVTVLLLGLYFISQATADVGATKFIVFGNYVLPAGTLIFALTFTLRDLVHKKLGASTTRYIIIVAGIANLLQSLYLYAMTKLDHPIWFEVGDSWNEIFSVVPYIMFASILAEVISMLIDTEIFEWLLKKYPSMYQWLRVLISNIVSLPVDSLIFALMAFMIFPAVFGGEQQPLQIIISMTTGQVIYKLAVTIVSLPAIYLV